MHSVIAELVRVIIEPASQKKPLGDRYITCWRYLGCYELAFESGAVLGYAFSDRLATLAQLFCDPGREQELAGWMKHAAVQRFTEQGEPKNFLDMAMWHEKSRAEEVWRKSGETEAEIERSIESYTLPLNDAFGRLQGAVTIGIGFGSTYPSLTERMWQDAYEKPNDPVELETMRKAGLSINGRTMDALPLAQQQEKLLSFVRLFVTQARPDLLPEFQWH